jgi:hypothetical protein
MTMKFKILVALFAVSALVTGCDDKKETGGDDDKKEDKKDKADKKGDDKKDAKKDDDGGELPGDCKAWKECINSMDETVKASMAPAFEQWEKTYNETSKEGRAAMISSCKTSLDALKTAGSCK